MKETDLDSRFLPLIFDSIAHGIFTIDSTGIITSFNRMAEELTGYHRYEVIGEPCSTIFKTEICATKCPLKKSIRSGERGEDQEVTIINRAGKSLPVAISTAALLDKGNQIIGGVEMFRDMRLVNELRKQIYKSYGIGDIITKNCRMQQICEMLPLLSNSVSTVLIEGESGTGKELVARAIHNLGQRREGPFVALNCGALPENLVESELFGYEKGAFTDAHKDKPGRLAAAEGGTLLLDEVGELPKYVQVKLLRVLQEKEYEPLGSNRSVRADVRIIAATNRELAEEVSKRRFRQDLYYRLNVVQLTLPPLLERKEDIPLLVAHFTKRFNTLQGRRIAGCSERVMYTLMRYPFPGNIRELENAIEHAFVVCIDSTIQMNDLPQHILDQVHEDQASEPQVNQPLKIAEEKTIRDQLKQYAYNRTQTAKALGMSRNTLWRKMKRYGITNPA